MPQDTYQKTSANAYKGHEIFSNQLSMQVKMLAHIVLYCAIFQGVIFVVVSLFTVDPEVSHALILTVWSKLLAAFNVQKVLEFDLHGKRIVTTVQALASKDFGSIALIALKSDLWLAKGASLFAWGLAPFLYRIFNSTAISHTQAQHIRGPRVITPAELNAQLKEERRQTRLPLGEIAIPIDYEPEHIFICGKTRVGKTVALLQMVAAMLKSKSKAVIYDFKGDYTSKIFDPSRDVIMNPVDARCPGWTITNDIRTKMDIVAIAQSLIPPSTGEDRFWSTAAQNIFQAVLTYAILSGKKSNRDLWATLTLPIEDLSALLAQTPGTEAAQSYLQDKKLAANVLAVTLGYTAWLEYAAENDGPFSIQSWLENREQSFIFLTGREEIQDTTKPMMSLFIDLLGKKFLSMADEKDRRLFFVLDEFGTLQKLPTITRLLTAGGSKGATVIIGVQDFAQLQKIYGKELAVTIHNSCGSTLALNVNDPETAKFFSERFGKAEWLIVNETQSMGVEDNRDGLSLSTQEQMKDLILPSEFQDLPKLQGFAKIPEHHVVRTRIPITAANNKPNVHEPFICRDGYDLASIQLKQAEVGARTETAKTQIVQTVVVDTNFDSDQGDTTNADSGSGGREQIIDPFTDEAQQRKSTYNIELENF